MLYQNSAGELYNLANMQALTSTISADTPLSHLEYINLVTVQQNTLSRIECINTKEKGTVAQFTSWLMQMIKLESDQITWEDYLQFRIKVLSVMEEVDNEETKTEPEV